jgi:hypothetical protein
MHATAACTQLSPQFSHELPRRLAQVITRQHLRKMRHCLTAYDNYIGSSEHFKQLLYKGAFRQWSPGATTA